MAIHKSLFLVLAAGFVCFGASWAFAQKAADQGPAKHSEPGKSAGTKTLEAGARLLQDTTPVKQLEMYLDGYHNLKSQAGLPGEQQHQMRVSHYCQQVNEDFVQCAIFDGNTPNAHLIGIEHIVSDKVYKSLPESEKNYWHPHDGEVDSGMLIAPGIPGPAHKRLMDKVRTTHGKTWHVWDTHKDPLPFGEPQLMWAIAPKQINAETRRSMEARKKAIKF